MRLDSNSITQIVKGIMKRRGLSTVKINTSASIYEDGLGLDSLDVAELSAQLEQAFGSDPFTSGRFPRSIDEIFSFYKTAGRSKKVR